MLLQIFDSTELGLLLIASLLSGHDCIDDLEEFDDDDLIQALFRGTLPTAKTMGNFLRRFSPENIRDLQLFMTQLGFTPRQHTLKVNPHKGESKYGSASQVIFDELGFCFAAELLEAAHPKGNAPKLLDQVLTPLRSAGFGARIVNRKVTTHKKELELIGKMRALRIEGLSYWKIADVLNAWKIPAKTRKGPWSAKQVH